MPNSLGARTVLAAVLLLCPAARAAVSLSLVPDNPGPYSGGETINIDVLLVNDGEGQMQMRLLQLDFSLSDPAVDLGPFEWDFSSLVSSALYGDFSSGEVYNRTYIGTAPQPGFLLEFVEGSNRLGSFSMQIPLEPRGYFCVDVANAQAPDNNSGAFFQWSFDDTQHAWSGDGTLGGGQLCYIPEPATGILLFWGGLFAGRRRR